MPWYTFGIGKISSLCRRLEILESKIVLYLLLLGHIFVTYFASHLEERILYIFHLMQV